MPIWASSWLLISDRLADVERRLGATPDEMAAIDAKATQEARQNGPVGAEAIKTLKST